MVDYLRLLNGYSSSARNSRKIFSPPSLVLLVTIFAILFSRVALADPPFLCRASPDVVFLYDVKIWDTQWPSGTTLLDSRNQRSSNTFPFTMTRCDCKAEATVTVSETGVSVSVSATGTGLDSTALYWEGISVRVNVVPYISYTGAKGFARSTQSTSGTVSLSLDEGEFFGDNNLLRASSNWPGTELEVMTFSSPGGTSISKSDSTRTTIQEWNLPTSPSITTTPDGGPVNPDDPDMPYTNYWRAGYTLFAGVSAKALASGNASATATGNYKIAFFEEDDNSQLLDLSKTRATICEEKPTENSCDGEGNPISPINGCKFQNESDYFGPSTLKFNRRYDSLGYLYDGLETKRQRGVTQWRHNYQSRLYRLGGGYTSIHRPDGQVWKFTPEGKQLNIDGGIYSRLNIEEDGWRLRLPHGDLEYYDAKGRLKRIEPGNKRFTELSYERGSYRIRVATDSFGNQLKFSYDDKSRLSTLIDPAGKRYVYRYDGRGNLSSIRYPDGAVKRYQYRDQRNPFALTEIVDENGDVFSSFLYTNNGLGRRTQYDDGQNRIDVKLLDERRTKAVDAEGYVRIHHFRNFGEIGGGAKLRTRIDHHNDPNNPADDTYESWKRDSYGNVLEYRDQLGRVTKYEYNEDNQLISSTEAHGTPEERTETYEYPRGGMSFRSAIVKPSVAPSQVSSKSISYASGFPGLPAVIRVNGYRQTGEQLPSKTTTFRYYGESDGPALHGQISYISYPERGSTSFTYYNCTSGGKCGQLETVENYLGHVTTFNSYDRHGRLTRQTDPNGLQTLYKYDLRGRLTQLIEVGNNRNVRRITSYGYDRAGQLKWSRSPTGEVLAYRYDKAHQLTHVFDGVRLGGRGRVLSHINEIRYRYDRRGNRIAEQYFDASDKLKKSLTTQFDAWNRARVINAGVGSMLSKTGMRYDAGGNLLSEVDPRYFANGSVTQRNQTRHRYDNLNRLRRTTDLIGGVTSYSYDVQDNLTRVKAPNGATTTYETDDFGMVWAEHSPDRGSITMKYNSNGDIIYREDARGVASLFQYDHLNRLTAKLYYSHDGNSNEKYSYDDCENGIGRLCRVEKDNDTSVSYKYDVFGNIKEVVTAIGVRTYTLKYGYEKGSRLNRIEYPSGLVVNYIYNSLGQTKGVVATINGQRYNLASNATYYPFGALASLTHGNGMREVRAYDTQYRPSMIKVGNVMNWRYQQDKAGNVVGIVSPNEVNQVYGYDRLQRLVSGRGEFGSVSYTYDKNGNRLTAASNNSVLARGKYTYQRGSNRLIRAAGKKQRLDDAGNQIDDGIQQYRYNMDGRLRMVIKNDVVIGRYRYNAFNQRVEKRVGDKVTHFQHDLDGWLLWENDAGSRGGRAYIHLGGRLLSVIDLAGASDSPRINYVHSDRLATPRIVTDDRQNVVWRWQSDPFGETKPKGTYKLNSRFPGQYADQENDYSYNWHRFYSPVNGRYLTSDPIGLFGGRNPFIYGKANPVSNFDYLGLKTQSNKCCLGVEMKCEVLCVSLPVTPFVWCQRAQLQCDGTTTMRDAGWYRWFDFPGNVVKVFTCGDFDRLVDRYNNPHWHNNPYSS